MQLLEIGADLETGSASFMLIDVCDCGSIGLLKRGYSMKNRNSGFVVRSGFTLIEMMVVILIILLLSGMIFKIASLVGSKAARARAIADIANIEYALAEYYSEYDIYPPTSENGYQYEFTGGQTDGLKVILDRRNDPDSPNFVTDAGHRVVKKGEPWKWGKSKQGHLGYSYGLVSYLYYRDRGTQSHWYDEDTERDKAAKLKWQHFLEDLDLSTYGVKKDPEDVGLEIPQPYTNLVSIIRDPWDHGYIYESKPPYMKYTLWSKGPDGKKDTGDDINNESFNE